MSVFQNILKWTFKIVACGVEKELNLHLDADTPIEAVEQVAMQMIAHCAKVKQNLEEQKQAEANAPVPDIVPEPKPAE